MKKLTLSERCVIHARKADGAGLYTTGNLLEELSIFVQKHEKNESVDNFSLLIKKAFKIFFLILLGVFAFLTCVFLPFAIFGLIANKILALIVGIIVAAIMPAVVYVLYNIIQLTFPRLIA